MHQNELRCPKCDGEWYPYVERLQPRHDRYDGPACEASLEGRVWCQVQIAALGE
jgi:hypothetical protein